MSRVVACWYGLRKSRQACEGGTELVDAAKVKGGFQRVNEMQTDEGYVVQDLGSETMERVCSQTLSNVSWDSLHGVGELGGLELL